ncbi:MAG: endonuclease VII domain-containing protein [Chloroflexi bacterium]|nr:endonuclease VII domain-containing protein [Chloroflexota bacterium]
MPYRDHTKGKAYHKAYCAAYYLAHKEECLERNRRYRLTHLPEEKLTALRGYLRRKYGITVEARGVLLAKQRGACAICGTPEVGGPRLHVDHDASSGKVRGLLCGNCNRGIGIFKHSSGRLLSAVEYLGRSICH